MNDSSLPHLSDIRFKRMRAKPELSPYVRWFWQIAAQSEDFLPRSEFLHCDGCVNITFNFGSDLDVFHGTSFRPVDSNRYNPGVTINAPQIESRSLNLRGHVHCFGILLQPGVSASLFRKPVQDIGDYTTAFLFNELYNQLCDTTTFSQRVNLSELSIMQLVTKADYVPSRVRNGLHLIDRTRGNIQVSALANALNISQRQFERQFKNHVGLTIKQYSSTMRIHYARHLIKTSSTLSLSDVALNAGFFDQAHFNRSFQSIIGLSPMRYINRSIKT